MAQNGKKRQRSRTSAAFELPKWVSAGQVNRLERALKKNPDLSVDAALLHFSREPVTADSGG